MRILASALCGIIFVFCGLHAQPRTASRMDEPARAAGSDYVPRIDSLKSDWAEQFGSDDARGDFKRLRTYLAEKQAELTDARAELSNYRSLVSQAESGVESRKGYLETVDRLLRTPSPDSTVAIAESFSLDFDVMLGHTTPGQVPISALRDLQRRLRDEDARAEKRLLAVQAAFRTLTANTATLELDLRRTEDAIDQALAPEIENQRFRRTMSIIFSLLIALLIGLFFFTIYKKSGNDAGGLLLSDGGLQFVTIFVLIIAIVLFGILNILEGRELAAILSGIAGYILGRGARMKAADPPREQQPAVTLPAAPATPPAAANAAPAAINIPKIFPEPAAAPVSPPVNEALVNNVQPTEPKDEDREVPKG